MLPQPSTYSDCVLASQPTAYWRLEEPSMPGAPYGSTVAPDSSGNGFHGTYLDENQMQGRAGLLAGSSQARRFLSATGDPAGAGQFSIPYTNSPAPAALRQPGSFTVEAWVNADERQIGPLHQPGAGRIQAIFRHLSGSTNQGGFELDVIEVPMDSGVFAVRIVAQGGNPSVFAPIHAGTMHVAGVRNAGQPDTLSLYINGVLRGSLPMQPGWVPNSTARIQVGLANGLTGLTFDEIAYYSRALSGQEIRSHFLCGGASNLGLA